jgi:solute carrier family 35, member E1
VKSQRALKIKQITPGHAAHHFCPFFACLLWPVVNKRVLNAFPAHLTVGMLQSACGGLIVTLFWKLNLRSRPTVREEKRNSFRALGLCAAAGQLSAIVSLGAGPVSFTHIVKSMEPFFSAMVSALLLNQWMNPVVYAALIPVVGGVGYACFNERSFSWLAFWMAMTSNLAYAFRAVLSKVAMDGGGSDSNSIGSNLTPPNVLGLITLECFWMSVPIALIGEGFGLRQMWSEAVQHHDAALLVQEIILSGMVNYFTNEAMFFCLDSVHPVTFSVGNTMKRVCIIFASILVFHNDITPQAAVGSAVGIVGALIYSLTKQHYEKLESKKGAQEKSAKKQR